MGQIPNKTYTAPDGSVYRVEADGSVTKIQGGRVQSNEPPSKYNITPDGKIYRVESDGSVTYLGNVEDRQTPPLHSSVAETKKSSHKWIWILVAIAVIVIGLVSYVMSIQNVTPIADEDITAQNYRNTEFQNYNSDYEDAAYDNDQYQEQTETPEEAAYKPITFPSDRDYICNDDYGYYEVVFGSNGVASIFRISYGEDVAYSNLVDNGSYELINGQISFNNFSYWPNETIYLYDDDSFELNSLSFQRGDM